MQPYEAARFRRKVLEELSEQPQTGPGKQFSNPQYLPAANPWSPGAVLSQLEILEHEQRVELKRIGEECAVKITPFGRKSLEVSEKEWQVSNKPVVNSNTLNITGPTVENIAHMAGSHGSTIN